MKKTQIKALEVTFADSLSQTCRLPFDMYLVLFWVDCHHASIMSWYLYLLFAVIELVRVFDPWIVYVCVIYSCTHLTAQAPITGWILKHRGKPLLFHDKCPGFFYVHYTTHGTYSFTSHPKDEAIMVKCLFNEIANKIPDNFTWNCKGPYTCMWNEK